jgi:serine-type D-Ala-D-Ala carboxypeptidase
MSQFNRFPETKKLLDQGIQDGVAPGFVAGFWSAAEPERYEMCALGERRLKWKGLPSQPMEVDTIFDMASVSKVYATAPLIALLVERGWLRWDTTVKSIFPQFASSEIQIQHLLSHTSGLTAWFPFFETLRKELASNDAIEFIEVLGRQERMKELVLDLKPEVAPGKKVLYSDPNFLILGFIIEAITDLPLDDAVSRFLWKGMGLKSPHYVRTNVPAFLARRESYAATEDCPWRGAVLQGQVHDDNCWTMGGYAGHAGVFSNIRDLLSYGRKLYEGEGFSRSTLKKMWSLAELPMGCDRTLGWDTPSGDAPAFLGFSRNSVGHLGFTGTSFWIDLDRGVVVSLLSNRVHPTRETQKIKPFRALFHQTLARELFR